MKLTKKIKSELLQSLQNSFKDQDPKEFAENFESFVEATDGDEWESRADLERDAYQFMRDCFEDPFEEIDSLELHLNIYELRFCQEYLQHFNKVEAYKASHPECKTYNPDSLRSLASRFIRRKSVAAYINETMKRYKESAFECGLWGRNQSLLQRKDMLCALNKEIELRNTNRQKEIALIEGDETITGAEKAQRIAAIMKHPIYSKDTIEAHKALCDSLDHIIYYQTT